MNKMKVDGPGRQRSGQGKHFCQEAKHAWLYSDLLQALKREHVSALGYQQRGSLISASAAPHYRGHLKRGRKKKKKSVPDCPAVPQHHRAKSKFHL